MSRMGGQLWWLVLCNTAMASFERRLRITWAQDKMATTLEICSDGKKTLQKFPILAQKLLTETKITAKSESQKTVYYFYQNDSKQAKHSSNQKPLLKFLMSYFLTRDNFFRKRFQAARKQYDCSINNLAKAMHLLSKGNNSCFLSVKKTKQKNYCSKI